MTGCEGRTGDFRATLSHWYSCLVMWSVLHLSPRHRRRMRARAEIAARHLRGEGLEIGALHMPVQLPPDARVRYLDYQDAEQQRLTYPELTWVEVVPVDIVADAQVLHSVPGASVDFVIANHVIEHCEDPVAALEAWFRVVRVGGILCVGVPDKRSTFDQERPLTTVEHVIADHRNGPDLSRRAHWEELSRLIYRIPEAEIDTFIDRQLAIGQHPHYHVWTIESFREMLEACRETIGLPFVIEEMVQIGAEFIAVLRKTATTSASDGPSR